MKLKKEILEKVKKNSGLKKEIVEADKITKQALSLRLKKNSKYLLSYSALCKISEHYNLPVEELVENC